MLAGKENYTKGNILSSDFRKLWNSVYESKGWPSLRNWWGDKNYGSEYKCKLKQTETEFNKPKKTQQIPQSKGFTLIWDQNITRVQTRLRTRESLFFFFQLWTIAFGKPLSL